MVDLQKTLSDIVSSGTTPSVKPEAILEHELWLCGVAKLIVGHINKSYSVQEYKPHTFRYRYPHQNIAPTNAQFDINTESLRIGNDCTFL